MIPIFGTSEPQHSLLNMYLYHLYGDFHYFCKHENFLQEKAVEATKQKEEKRKKTKPEEHEGMPQRRHYPLEKRRGDRNPECHEGQQKDVV
jgi:hypothetical protein